MTGLEALRLDLESPELTAEMAEWLLNTVDASQLQREAARMRYAPYHPSLLFREIAVEQGTQTSGVSKRLGAWRRRALVMLEGGR